MAGNSIFISPNCLMAECVINPSSGFTTTENIFQPQQQLQNRKIVAIEAYSNQDCAYSPISTSNEVVPPYLFKNLFLSIFTSSLLDAKGNLIRPEGLYYDKIPLSIMRRVNNYDTNVFDVTSGGRDLFRIRPSELDFTKTTVVAPRPIAIGTTYSALFLFHYVDKGDPGVQYMM